jgi:hypothetical protein
MNTEATEIVATIVESANVPAVHHAGARALGGIPHLEQYLELAERVARTAMVPASFRNKPDEVLAVVLYGAELGIGPMQALQQINFISGKPSPAAELQRALIMEAGHKFVLTTNNEVATARCKRLDWDDYEETTFTMLDARVAGITGGDNWRKYPDQMLAARVTSKAARMWFADVIAGMSYTPEEIESFTPTTRTPSSASATTPRRAGPAEETGEVASDDQTYAITTALGLLTVDDKATVRAAWIAAGLPSLARGLTSIQAEGAMQIILDVLNAVGAGVVDAEVVESVDTTDTTKASSSEVDAPLATKFQVTKIQTMLTTLGVAHVDRHEYVGAIIDHSIASMNDLTKTEAHIVIDRLDDNTVVDEVAQ